MKLEEYFNVVEKNHEDLIKFSGPDMIKKVDNLSNERSLYNKLKMIDLNVDEIYFSKGIVKLITPDYSKMDDLSLSHRNNWLTFNFEKTISYEKFDGLSDFLRVTLMTPEIINKNLDVIYTNQNLVGPKTKIDYFVSLDEIIDYYSSKGIKESLVDELGFYIKKFRNGISPFEKDDPRL